MDVSKVTKDCINWIKDWFNKNGKDCNCIIGISGGKDSSVCAALCVEALGKDRVIGVLMPNGIQEDIEYARLLVNSLQIKSFEFNIGSNFELMVNNLNSIIEVKDQTLINLPARLRMVSLYAISQSLNGRVCNTCNYSEDYVGYSTKYGDGAGDFSPMANLTVTEVKQIGHYLKLDPRLVEKTPIDGLCGKTDEDNLGFTYEVLDKYIRDGINPPLEIKNRIDYLHKTNLFKLQLMESFPYKKD